MFLKILKPHFTSFDSFESSGVGAVRGFLGNSQAVTMVVSVETSGPLIL